MVKVTYNKGYNRIMSIFFNTYIAILIQFFRLTATDQEEIENII